MTRKDDGGAAFPTTYFSDSTTIHGMSLRDYFASQAMNGMLSYSHVSNRNGNFVENCRPCDLAERAYEYADEMLKARQS